VFRRRGGGGREEEGRLQTDICAVKDPVTTSDDDIAAARVLA